jgi:Flp pilus assembly protein TadD
MGKYNDIQQEAIDERIESFLRGTMTEEEEANFKQEIKADPELRNYVMATVSLIKGIRDKDAAEEKAIIQNNTKDRARTLIWWACSIAAVFAIFFGYQKDKRFNELSDIVSPYYSEYSMSDYSRGDVDSNTVAHLYTLFNNIKEQRNVSSIIAELEPIYANIDSDFTYSAYANDIAMNLALAYIKNDQTDKAVIVLQKLVEDNPDMPIAVKANELLIKLRE